MGIDWDDRSTWPAWVAEEVALAPHDPRWLEDGRREAARLTTMLDDAATGSVAHIGSTAVTGLAAKPILDFVVASTDRHRTAVHLAAQLGDPWVLIPDGLHPLPIRLLVRVEDGRRHSHLQVVDPSDAHLQRLLAFRDALRADREARDAYAAVKSAAAESLGRDRAAYTEAKAEVIATILRGVGVEPA